MPLFYLIQSRPLWLIKQMKKIVYRDKSLLKMWEEEESLLSKFMKNMLTRKTTKW